MKYKFDIEKIHTLKLEPGEVLVVRLNDEDRVVDHATIRRVQEHLINLLETKKVLVYTGCTLEFLKLGLQDHLVDEFLEKELSKK